MHLKSRFCKGTIFFSINDHIYRISTQDPQLVQENDEDGHGAHESNEKEVGAEECGAQSAPVGELVFHNVLGHKPAQEDAGEESAYGQENLSGYKVEHIEERHAE